MLKSKVYIICVLFFIGALTASATNVKLEPDKIINLEPDSSQYVNKAENNFQQGKSFLGNGEIGKAKQYFDNVVDTLLETESKSAEQKELLMLYVSKISEMEFNYLEDRNSQPAETPSSFIEEVVSTPLFEPSKEDIQSINEKIGQQISDIKSTIPMSENVAVAAFINAFQKIKFKNIQRALNRSVEYVDTYKQIFREQGIPEDLAYLPIIESGYRTMATSRARAGGIWQFMAGTARLYGLRVDGIVDERRDPYKSAVAAAKYLKRLHEDYGDWYIAVACYNAGPKRLNTAMNRLKTDDFFTICKSKYIRKETRNYVPAFLASILIAKNPESYGFTIEPSETETLFQTSKTITIPSPVSLKDVASLGNFPFDVIKELNPELIRDITPFDTDTYTIRVPKDTDETVFSELKRIPPNKKYFLSDSKSYKIRKGDNLYSIAKKFHISVQKLKSANRIHNNRLKPGQRLNIPG